MKHQMNRNGSIEKRNYSHNVLMLCPDFALFDVQSTSVFVLDAPLPSNSDFYVKFLNPCKSTFVRGERINDTTLAFKSPGNFPVGEAKISVHHGPEHTKLCVYGKNFTFKSKVERAYDLLQASINPIHFLANAFNLDEKDSVTIDFKLEQLLRANMPNNFNLLQNQLQGNNKAAPLNGLNVPTLLHFAARYNLVGLYVALLECPGAQEALLITNKDGKTPRMLAKDYGNSHLSDIMPRQMCKDEHGRSGSVDEIYEHMSSEIYERYVKVKKDFYEDMQSIDDDDDDDDDVYEDMYECRRSSENSRSIPADRQSVYSSDSGLSVSSTDSKGSAGCGNSDSSTESKRNNKTLLNPLVSELKRKNEERRGLTDPGDPPNIPHRAPQRHRIQPPPRPTPKSAFSQQEQYTEKSPNGGNEDFYDIPPNSNKQVDECYDVPPSRLQISNGTELYDIPPLNNNSYQKHNVMQVTPPVRSNHKNEGYGTLASNRNSYHQDDEMYDTPPVKNNNRKEVYDIPPISKNCYWEDDEVYETPPITNNNREEVYDTPPASKNPYRQSNEVYDTPPITNNDREEVYDTPPASKNPYRQNDEVYDTPPITNIQREELYDTPPPGGSSHQPDDEVYDTPPPRNTSTEEVYDIPPSQRRVLLNRETNSTPAPFHHDSNNYYFNRKNVDKGDNSNSSDDEVYDDLAPLNPQYSSHGELFSGYYKHGGKNVPNLASFNKRFSEPSIVVPRHLVEGDKPILPPPNLPRRNPNHVAPKMHNRPCPPVPPHNRR